MIWNIKKQKTIKTTGRKKIKKTNKQGSCKKPQGQLQEVQIYIIGVPEGEENDQDIGNLLEKIMKENFPNLVK